MIRINWPLVLIGLGFLIGCSTSQGNQLLIKNLSPELTEETIQVMINESIFFDGVVVYSDVSSFYEAQEFNIPKSSDSVTVCVELPGLFIKKCTRCLSSDLKTLIVTTSLSYNFDHPKSAMIPFLTEKERKEIEEVQIKIACFSSFKNIVPQ